MLLPISGSTAVELVRCRLVSATIRKHRRPMEGELPPLGPYVGAKTVFEIKEAIEKTVELIEEAGEGSDECLVALESLRDLVKKVS